VVLPSLELQLAPESYSWKAGKGSLVLADPRFRRRWAAGVQPETVAGVLCVRGCDTVEAPALPFPSPAHPPLSLSSACWTPENARMSVTLRVQSL